MAEESKKDGRNVLVGATGSVAAIKIPELVKKLTECQDPKVINQKNYHSIFIYSANIIIPFSLMSK